jgi:hypothetical protein
LAGHIHDTSRRENVTEAHQREIGDLHGGG